MIIMDLKIDNFFAFKNFHMNMSYPKKIVDSPIHGEFLKDRENFRYKKVNIIMGANATGKTSIGRMLMMIFNFIERKEAEKLIGKICDISKSASFTMDFITWGYKLYRIDVKVYPQDDGDDEIKIGVCTRSVDINKRDNYETCSGKLDKVPLSYNDNFIEELNKIEQLTWMFAYPSDAVPGRVKYAQNPDFPTFLDYTLRALDPSIQKVEILRKVKNAYVIRMESQDIIIQDGEVVKENILSSGTKAGIDIAHMLSSIYAGECGFYYCDEKFSYIHSEIEKAFLSVMIDGLRDNDQLFFTTHNMDVLDLTLPKHTFSFLKKDISDIAQPMKVICASDYLKKSSDSLRNAVDNDLFSAAPNVELIYEMAELNAR